MDSFGRSRYFNAPQMAEIFDQQQTGSCGRIRGYYGEPPGVVSIRRRRGGLKEILFQSFEIVNVEIVFPIRDEVKNVEFSMASLKYALTVIRSGHLLGWGRMMKLPNNKDHTGLGYNTQNLKKTMLIAKKG